MSNKETIVALKSGEQASLSPGAYEVLTGAVERAGCTRESVDDALLIVGSYGPWGADLNDAHRRQIVLADEVKRMTGMSEALQAEWDRECCDTDAILSVLGLDPVNCRTDGGSLKLQDVLETLKHCVAALKYEARLHKDRADDCGRLARMVLDCCPTAKCTNPARECMPTPAMCRAAVEYLNGAAVYDKLPREALEIEEGIYAEVWKAMQAAAPGA